MQALNYYPLPGNQPINCKQTALRLEFPSQSGEVESLFLQMSGFVSSRICFFVHDDKYDQRIKFGCVTCDNKDSCGMTAKNTLTQSDINVTFKTFRFEKHKSKIFPFQPQGKP